MTQRFGKVGVLYGGRSAEREVSLMSGAGVHEALRSAGVDAHLFDTGLQDLTALEAAGFERVFIALHGRFGEDGAIQGALELLNIPYTGSGVTASALAMDKIMTKRVWLQHGLPTPAFEEIDSDTELRRVPDRLGLPLILKPPHEGSTVGITKVAACADMEQAYAAASHFDEVVLAEQFVRGRELTVALLGSGRNARALPVIEIVAPDGNYDYQNKYFTDVTQYFCPADLPVGVAEQIEKIAVQAYRALGCEGWGRADFILDGQNQPWLLEMNTSPGMTSHSLVPMAARAVGMSYAELCVAILADASCKLRAPARANG
ncbi:D-alanine--D-alanine ligase [Bordetella avium]|uniref:D-alanine--D-alanine ligase n=1 Tax=Bordetella avium (strain 197N) TaxID=360910 RepID=DDL_BORA1|nr:D-alanine--D-alanine ligase [Bordetella avium]Q2KVG4.1 RecName: Full=D-alanine--D-alanine ligase; AltName: Full=D-Ala-D-Ala ligase; AltName: Full=D-alanylalanine synthetase [Bordetella avium 197N]AZY53631.1 D-alanine--D-alanine ligase [Bordetella avium]RIQ11636.1 D-alanine--D-alanine ligase [Bordetella avium]RIQ35626.1 D-alanine--D-alanine ligase [Bordetella avium]RIQ38847.1 D-alanine--D-alanine ligase [Bordetella avium]RIQ40059.1 D-alanine--D-alanine ligase [Bordetella avium]